MFPPLPTGDETLQTPEGGDKEILFPLVSSSPVTCLHQWYAKEAVESSGGTSLCSSKQFVCWHDKGLPHLLQWTALFVCPLTAEVFTAAPYRVWEMPEREPVFDKKLWWFPNKTAAKNAVAGRALDCFSYRKYEYRFQRLSCAIPYEIVDEVEDEDEEEDEDTDISITEQCNDTTVSSQGQVAPVLTVQEQEQTLEEETSSDDMKRKNVDKSAGDELDENGDMVFSDENEWERQLLGPLESEQLDRLRRECVVHRQELEVNEEVLFDQEDQDGEEYSYRLQPGARVIHNPTAKNKISEYYSSWYDIPLHSKQYVAWRDNNGHWSAALVCPQNGELFAARGVSREEAEARAAKQALDTIQERHNESRSVLDSDRAIILEGVVQPEILSLQRFAVDPLPDLQVLIDKCEYADMIDLDRQGDRPDQIDTYGPGGKHESPLKSLEHWCQYYYGICVKKETFFTFEYAVNQGFYSCAWINPYTGEVFPAVPCFLVDQEYQGAVQEEHLYFFPGKLDAHMGAAALAIDCLRLRKELKVIPNRWTTQVPYLEPKTESYLDDLPNEIADQLCDKIPRVLQQPRLRRDVAVVLAKQNNEEECVNEQIDVIMDDGDKVEGDNHQQGQEGADQGEEIFPLERGGNCARNPRKTFAHIKYGAKDISDDRFILWMKLGINQQVVWACAFQDEESGELFLASRYNDKASFQDPDTGVWWFRNAQYARKSAAARACDCYAARTGNTAAPRYCEEEPSLEDENMSHEDLEAKGLWDCLRYDRKLK